MKQIWKLACIVITGVLTACAGGLPPTPEGVTPLVYQGQYVLRSEVAAEWCQGVPNDPNASCVEDVGDTTYLVTPIADGYAIIRAEAGAFSSDPVPYDRSKDLCYTDFPDQECDPNWYFSVDARDTPNDPLYGSQWALENIKAREAWEVAPTSNVAVAVTDTGVDCSHPEVNCIGEYNAITDMEGPGAASDKNGHGTHVATTIGARCNNATGICGVGSGIPILACKFLGDSGGGSLSDAIKCLAWARQKGAKVVNASWGCAGCYSKTLLSAIRESRDAGLLVFAAAAGNSGVNNDDYPHYPSDYRIDGFDPIISVAAIDQAQKKASFSNYGLKSVDVAAPGVAIPAGWPGGGYKTISGTSMATPHIAAASSLLIGLGDTNPRQSILESATPVSGDWGNGGTLDLAKAVGLGGSEPEPTPNPCPQKKLRKCYGVCQDGFRCKYPRQRACRKECREKMGCSKKR